MATLWKIDNDNKEFRPIKSLWSRYSTIWGGYVRIHTCDPKKTINKHKL